MAPQPKQRPRTSARSGCRLRVQAVSMAQQEGIVRESDLSPSIPQAGKGPLSPGHALTTTYLTPDLVDDGDEQ